MSAVLSVDATVRRPEFELAVAFELEAGEVLATMGPNGSGKSTLLGVIAGIVDAEGRVEVNGVPYLGDGRFVGPADREVGVVFQDYLLFPHLNALDNVAFGLRCRGARRRSARAAAAEWLDRFDVGGLAHRRPDELSGGQAQRVALARALAIEPRVLLLDEPLSALDASVRHDVRRDLRRHLADFGGTTVLVTHDPVDAFSLASRALVLENGVVTQSGSIADLVAAPRSRFVADLVGVNQYRGTRRRDGSIELDGGGSLVAAEASDAGGPSTGATAGDAVFVVVRPNSVGVHTTPPAGSARNVWAGEIDTLEVGGGRTRVRVLGTPSIVAEVTSSAVADLGLAVGATVWVSVKATEIEVLPA